MSVKKLAQKILPFDCISVDLQKKNRCVRSSRPSLTPESLPVGAWRMQFRFSSIQAP